MVFSLHQFALFGAYLFPFIRRREDATFRCLNTPIFLDLDGNEYYSGGAGRHGGRYVGYLEAAAAFISVSIHYPFLMAFSYFDYLRGSGLSVVGPPSNQERGSPRNDNGRGQPVNNIFRIAQNHGQEESADGNSQSFSHIITMYRSGFTVDDGPYRRLDDPANAPFLDNLGNG